MQPHPSRPVRWGERGNFAMLFAFTLPLLFAFGAVVVDLGYLYWTNHRAQVLAEAVALGAVKELNGTPAGVSSARQVASQLASLNDPRGEFSFNSSSEVITGVWGVNTQTGKMEFTSSTEPLAINALRVTINRSQSKGNAAPRFFARFFASSDINVGNSAVAVVAEDSGASADCNIAAGNNMNISGSVVVNGRACSNSNITISGSVKINGDLSCGPPPSNTNINGSARITGSRTCLEKKMTMTPVNIAPFRTSNDNAKAVCSKAGCINSSKDVSLSGQETLTLPAGTYFFNNFNVSGQARVIINGKVTIYLDQGLSLSGVGFVNGSQNPDNLRILVDGGGVSMSGTSDFYGHVYGNDTSMSLSGTAKFFGSMVGKDVNVSGNFTFEGSGGQPPSGSSSTGGLVSLVQ